MFDGNAWTSLVVWLGLPWVTLLLFVALFVPPSSWDEWFSKLKKPSLVFPRRYFRHLGFAACALLGIAGLLTQHLGDPEHAAMHVGLAFHLIQLVLVCAWLLLFFDYHYLWIATVVAVSALVSTSIAFIACALAVGWSLLVYLPYWVLVASSTAMCGVIAFENQQPQPQQHNIIDVNQLGNSVAIDDQ